MTASWVYFIQADDRGPIKIGISSNVQKRLDALQTANPHDLTLVGSFPGDWRVEQYLHRKFAAGRLRGEWFSFATPGLAELASDLLRDVLPDDLDVASRAYQESLLEKKRDKERPTAWKELPDDPLEEEPPDAAPCVSCGWRVEPELLLGGQVDCYACLKEAA